MQKRLWSLLLLPTWTSARPSSCAANNCYRDVAASNFPTRSGRADCSSYLKATVTPAVSTVYTTLTFTDVATEVISLTDTQTTFTYPASTAVVDVTATESSFLSVTQTRTTTVPSFTTQTIQLTTTIKYIVTTTIQVTQLAKRQQPTAQSSIPTYASNCRNPSQYSSACSCFGVTAVTVTADAPSTIITMSTTITPSTTSISTIVSTEIITSTATTAIVSQTTTVSTETDVLPTTVATVFVTSVSTITQSTSEYAFTTKIPGATVTVTNIQTLPTLASFRLVVSSSTLGKQVGKYIGIKMVNSVQYLGFVAPSDPSTFFSLDSAGRLSANGSRVAYPNGRCSSTVILSQSSNYNNIVCQIDKKTLELTCPTISQPVLAYIGYNTNDFGLAKTTCDIAFQQGFEPVRMTAIPA